MKKDLSRFTARLEVTPLPDGKRWRTLRMFFYDIRAKGSGSRITVPAGFVTDFASVPWVFWALFPKWGRYGKAAVIHDYLYQLHGYRNHCTGMWNDVDRELADYLFDEAMIVLNVAPWRRRLMYLAVRWFGWLAWRKRR